MINIDVPTKRGTILNGVLFDTNYADTVVISITGVHGNFYSNPFYYNFGDTLNSGGVDFIYAQTNDAYNKIKTYNTISGQEEIIGSFNEDFSLANEDVVAYVDFAVSRGYKHIILGGHSLGANKVIHYLAQNHDSRVEHFILFSPANLKFLTKNVSDTDKQIIKNQITAGAGNQMLPFDFLGWLPCVANTANQWIFENILDIFHTEKDADFTDVEHVKHTGALLIGTYDNFALGNPVEFLKNINSHFQHSDKNELIFIENTGHTYQQHEQETAEKLLQLVKKWRK